MCMRRPGASLSFLEEAASAMVLGGVEVGWEEEREGESRFCDVYGMETMRATDRRLAVVVTIVVNIITSLAVLRHPQ